MKVNQAVFGVFHHFELGRELQRRGLLGRIYSTFPWIRLKREGLPHTKVDTSRGSTARKCFSGV